MLAAVLLFGLFAVASVAEENDCRVGDDDCTSTSSGVKVNGVRYCCPNGRGVWFIGEAVINDVRYTNYCKCRQSGKRDFNFGYIINGTDIRKMTDEEKAKFQSAQQTFQDTLKQKLDDIKKFTENLQSWWKL